jgi:putative nucleotidyltransferase with HDIG domain
MRIKRTRSQLWFWALHLTALIAVAGSVAFDLSGIIGVAALLSVGIAVLIRITSQQRRDLILARQDSQRHQLAYEQIATNLPIGLYTYRDGRIEDANGMWDAMVSCQPNEDRTSALTRAIHEEDLGVVTRALDSVQDSGKPFHLRFRIRTSATELRHFESRGLWVKKPEEGIENLLGFFVDVTDLVQVQELLEARNREVQKKNEMLSSAVAELEENLEAMVRGLVKAVEAKDAYTAGHSERVMRYSLLIAKELGLAPQQLRNLARGTLIHDVGKIGIPDVVLNKPGRLSDDEFAVIKSHPEIGAQMVRGIPVFEDCLPIIQSHHERLDGSGYPHGLCGSEIPTLVRIASVADVFDAITSDRAYRTAMKVEEALVILRNDADSGALDGKIVDVFTDIVKRDGIGRVQRQTAA